MECLNECVEVKGHRNGLQAMLLADPKKTVLLSGYGFYEFSFTRDLSL